MLETYVPQLFLLEIKNEFTSNIKAPKGECIVSFALLEVAIINKYLIRDYLSAALLGTSPVITVDKLHDDCSKWKFIASASLFIN